VRLTPALFPGDGTRRKETTMHGRRSTRRSFLGTVVGAAAILGLKRVPGTPAALAADAEYPSASSFKTNCERNGGVFIDSPQDGLTACFYRDGSKDVCNTSGGNCTHYPPPPKNQINSGTNVADAPFIVDGTEIMTPGEPPLVAIAETPGDGPLDRQDPNQDITKPTRTHGKKSRKGRKGHK
jgi:hypothetical protein